MTTMASLRGEPLADAADPRLYMARSASEAVLAGLRRWLDGRGRLALVAGPPGTGTTLVLRVLERAERARRRVLFSPFLHIDPDALERWLVSLAPRPREPLAGDPLLAAFGLERRGALPPLLLVDDAHAALPATLEALGRLARERLPTLRVVLGGCAGRALHAAEAAFGEQGARFALTAWTPDELRALGATICAHPALDADARARLRGLDLGSLASDAQGSVRLLKNALATRCARERREAPSAPDAEARSPAAEAASPAPVKVEVAAAPVKVEVAAAPQSAVTAPEPERPATAAAEAAPAPAPVPPSVASTPEPVPEPVREAPPAPVPRARDPQEIGAVPKFRPRPARPPEPRPAPNAADTFDGASAARVPAPSAPQPVRPAPPAPAPVARSVDEGRISVSAPPRKAQPKPAAAPSAPRQAEPKPSPAPPPRAARAPEPARTASPRRTEPSAAKSAAPRPPATGRRSALNAFIRGFAKSPRAGTAPTRKPTAVSTTPEPAPRPAPPPVAPPAPPPAARPAPPPGAPAPRPPPAHAAPPSSRSPRPAAPRPVPVSPPRPAPAARSTPPPRATPRPPAIRRRPARPARRRGGARVLYALAVCVAVAAGAGVGLFAGWQYDGRLGLPAWLESALAEAATPPGQAAAPPDVAAAPPPAAAAPELRAAPAPEPERWSVHVNAQPWAWIRLDGAEVGATPLVAPDVPSGAHEFEATFPDGRRERRVVEIGPDSRFVSFR